MGIFTLYGILPCVCTADTHPSLANFMCLGTVWRWSYDICVKGSPVQYRTVSGHGEKPYSVKGALGWHPQISGHFSVSQILWAGTWQCQSMFSAFYHRDLTLKSDIFSIGLWWHSALITLSHMGVFVVIVVGLLIEVLMASSLSSQAMIVIVKSYQEL